MTPRQMVMDLYNGSRDRLRSPLLFSFIVSWLVINWRVGYITLFPDENFLIGCSRLEYLGDYFHYSNRGNLLVVPLLSAIGIVVLLPLSNILVNLVRHKLIDLDMRVKQQTPADSDELKKLRDDFIKLDFEKGEGDRLLKGKITKLEESKDAELNNLAIEHEQEVGIWVEKIEGLATEKIEFVNELSNLKEELSALEKDRNQVRNRLENLYSKEHIFSLATQILKFCYKMNINPKEIESILNGEKAKEMHSSIRRDLYYEFIGSKLINTNNNADSFVPTELGYAVFRSMGLVIKSDEGSVPKFKELFPFLDRDPIKIDNTSNK